MTNYRINFTIILLLYISLNKTMALETPKHALIVKEDGYEIREYQSMIIATTRVQSDYRNATSTGFRRIANYIFGGNSTGMNIEMTAPVISNVPDADDIYDIQFVMPSEHSLEDLPQPNNGYVSIKEVNLGKTAVLRFGGWATKERASYYKDKLSGLIAIKGYNPKGVFMVAQYNSPWVLPPFRKNEIIVPIN
mgnify:FL=1